MRSGRISRTIFTPCQGCQYVRFGAILAIFRQPFGDKNYEPGDLATGDFLAIFYIFAAILVTFDKKAFFLNFFPTTYVCPSQFLYFSYAPKSYDNAPNMSGKYQGIQARILELNPYAIFVPCCAHSLNLVGKTAVSACPAADDFFSL